MYTLIPKNKILRVLKKIKIKVFLSENNTIHQIAKIICRDTITIKKTYYLRWIALNHIRKIKT